MPNKHREKPVQKHADPVYIVTGDDDASLTRASQANPVYFKPVISTSTNDEARQRTVSQKEALDLQQTMTLLLGELRLLNTRFEEAFKTGINEGDIPDED